MTPAQRMTGGGLCQVICDRGGVRIHSHSLMVYTGLSIAAITGAFIARLTAVAPLGFLLAALALVVAGFIGARLLHVVIHFPLYHRHPRRLWNRLDGGAAAQGGVLLALAVSVPLLDAMHLSLGVFWDTATIPMLIWLMFGKVGCLLHGCCCGRPMPGCWSLYLPDHRGNWCHRVPTQVLEAALALLVLLASAAFWNERPFAGAFFLLALATYSAGRFFLQPLRETDERIGPIRVQQGLALCLFLLGALGFLFASAASPVTGFMESPL